MQEKYGRSAKNNKLKQWLKKEGMSIYSFAAMIGIDYFTARRYVANERAPVLVIAIIIEEFTHGQVPCSSWFDLAISKKTDQRKNKKKH